MDKPSGRQIAAARTLIGVTQADLAAKANISVPTLKRMEASEGPAVGMQNNVDAVVRALESAGVIFQAEGETVDGGPGVRLSK
jgi:transcriptional regulator with XRE-family HTH domain